MGRRSDYRRVCRFGAGLAGFVFVESRAADPIVPLSSFRNRTFTFMIISIFMMGGSLYAVVTYLPLSSRACWCIRHGIGRDHHAFDAGGGRW